MSARTWERMGRASELYWLALGAAMNALHNAGRHGRMGQPITRTAISAAHARRVALRRAKRHVGR